MMKKYSLLILTLIILILSFLNCWYSVELLDLLFIVTFILNLVLFIIYITCFKLVVKELVQNKNIVNIISGIINIILLSNKTEGIEEKIKGKKEFPVLEDITRYKWYIYLIIFIFLFILCYTPVIDAIPFPKTFITSIITMILLYAIQIVLLVIPMATELKRDFIAFKNNFKLYLSKILPRFGIIVIAYFVCNLTLMLFIESIPTNQAILNSLPIYITAPLAIIIAPIIEELMFRGFTKKFIKNDILFVILSSLIFGGLHVAVAEGFKQMLFIIPYSILGFAFSLNYMKTKNIVSNIFLHSAWNSLAVIAMILVKFL